jgi:hypothetical protein
MPSYEDQATLQAYALGVDQAARDAEARWGAGRLPLIVGDELRARFMRQQAKWYAAHETAWAARIVTGPMLAEVAAHAAALRRAWQALEAEATANGHEPKDPDVWEVVLGDGTVAAFVQTNADASKVLASGRHLAVYTLDEVARIIDALPASLSCAKVAFKGAAIVSSVGPIGRHGDPIPF